MTKKKRSNQDINTRKLPNTSPCTEAFCESVLAYLDPTPSIYSVKSWLDKYIIKVNPLLADPIELAKHIALNDQLYTVRSQPLTLKKIEPPKKLRQDNKDPYSDPDDGRGKGRYHYTKWEVGT